MLCCLWQDPQSAYTDQTGVSPFPGQRRPLLPTNGAAGPDGGTVASQSSTGAPLMVNGEFLFLATITY